MAGFLGFSLQFVSDPTLSEFLCLPLCTTTTTLPVSVYQCIIDCLSLGHFLVLLPGCSSILQGATREGPLAVLGHFGSFSHDAARDQPMDVKSNEIDHELAVICIDPFDLVRIEMRRSSCDHVSSQLGLSSPIIHVSRRSSSSAAISIPDANEPVFLNHRANENRRACLSIQEMVICWQRRR